jgi:hypothetical protein
MAVCAIQGTNSARVEIKLSWFAHPKEGMMDVIIIETKTGKLVTKIPVVLQGIGYTPSEQDYYEMAWQCAVDDKNVDPDRRAEYGFQLVFT